MANHNFFFCHLGRFISDDPINSRAMSSTFRRSWADGEKVNILEVGHNTYLFCFLDEVTRDRVSTGGPWGFNRKLLLLKPWEIGQPLQGVTFEYHDVWVQVLQLPILLINEETGRRIMEEIGEMTVSDFTIHSEEAVGNYVRVRTRLSILEPLPRGIHILMKGERKWVDFRYERIPTVQQAPTDSISSLSFSPKANFLVATSWDKQVALQRYTKMRGDAPERLVSGSDDFIMFLWEPSVSRKPKARMTGHQQLVNHVYFSPDGQWVAIASFDKSVKLWNGITGKFFCAFQGHVGPIYQISWSADSRLLLSGSKDFRMSLTLDIWLRSQTDLVVSNSWMMQES